MSVTQSMYRTVHVAYQATSKVSCYNEWNPFLLCSHLLGLEKGL